MLTFPNAKINIGLNITEKRPDGYHNIETVFYPIGLQDALEIVPSETCVEYSFSSSGIPIDSDPDENLVVKAYYLLKRNFALPPIDIFLHKAIPSGAGLGGGSSDAAFMLKMLNEEFSLKLSNAKLEKYASMLGADCAFFIKNKPVFATGIGNVFQPVQLSLKNYFFVLVKPDVHVSTAEAYSCITPKESEVSVLSAIKRPVSEWKLWIKNDFETGVFDRYPVIGEIKSELYNRGALYASMSGSGSSVYGIFEEEIGLKDLFEGCFVTAGKL